MKTSTHPVETVNASPSKRIYQSIIADYDLNRAICELIDNALDAWQQDGRKAPLRISIILDSIQQSILVEDNAGGVPRPDLRAIVSPGESRNRSTDPTIGYFGVGSKRAAVALAMSVIISTRAGSEGGYRIQYDDEWLESEDDWDLPIYAVDGLPEGTTIISLNRLRVHVDDEAIKRLVVHLSETYGRFLVDSKLQLTINSQPIPSAGLDTWAYPPEFEPRRIKISVPGANARVYVEILGGLMRTASPGTGDYGVYVYCNERLIAPRLKTHDVGFVSGQAGKPHPTASLMRVVVSFRGPSGSMPWNSSKSDLHVQHWTFRAIQPNVVSAVAYWATLSRRLEGEWTTRVRPHSVGTVVDEGLQQPGKAGRSYLPKLPNKRPPRYSDVLKNSNSSIRQKKPWTAGLIDALMAIDVILGDRRIEQRNRIALVLLDSTLEIAFKDYLVNESGQAYSETTLVKLFSNRGNVQAEFRKFVELSASLWAKVDHFYKLRCKLVHERASSGISDEEVENYQKAVKSILRKAFGLKV